MRILSTAGVRKTPFPACVNILSTAGVRNTPFPACVNSRLLNFQVSDCRCRIFLLNSRVLKSVIAFMTCSAIE